MVWGQGGEEPGEAACTRDGAWAGPCLEELQSPCWKLLGGGRKALASVGMSFFQAKLDVGWKNARGERPHLGQIQKPWCKGLQCRSLAVTGVPMPAEPSLPCAKGPTGLAMPGFVLPHGEGEDCPGAGAGRGGCSRQGFPRCWSMLRSRSGLVRGSIGLEMPLGKEKE